MRKKNIIIVCVVLLSLFAMRAHAQSTDQTSAAPVTQNKTVDYQGQPAVDSDLDGLTDAAEAQLYHTDAHNPDTDGDGWSDGSEVISGTNPLDPSSYPGAPAPAPAPTASVQTVQVETPWAWYISRASALVGFVLLYISIFLGLTLRVPFLRKIFSPAYSMSVHCWISLQALLFALLHGAILLFDKAFHFNVFDLFVPFASSFQPNLMAMGIIAFWFMLILVITSYGRRFMTQKMWRLTHSLNILLYIFVIVHALNLGTDMKNETVRAIFIWANALLVFIMLYNVQLRIVESMKRRLAQASQTAASIDDSQQ